MLQLADIVQVLALKNKQGGMIRPYVVPRQGILRFGSESPSGQVSILRG